MPSPVTHHHALGIHPGAFVQPTAPNTADVQDGVLWIDTSAGPPYQLKRWDADGAVWHAVQMDQTGYPLPDGSRLECDPPGGEPPAPVTNILLTSFDAALDFSESLIPNLDVTILGSAGPLTISWHVWAHTITPTVLKFIIRLRRTDIGGDILASHDMKDLLNADPGPTHLYTDTYTDTAPTDAHYVLTLEADNGADFSHMFVNTGIGDDHTNLTVSASSSPPIERLRGPDGHTRWSHDGTKMILYAGTTAVVQTPFPTLGHPAAQVLGKDAATGLPMWSSITPPPAPPPRVSDAFGGPDETATDTTDYPMPAPAPPPDAQRVCGAADAMANLLVNIDNAMVYTINTSKGLILGGFTMALKRLVRAQLVTLLTEGALAQYEILVPQLLVDVIVASVLGVIGLSTKLPVIKDNDLMPPDGDSIYQVIRCCAFQALWLRAGNYLLEAESSNGLGTRVNWQMYLDADWSFFAGSTFPGVGPTNLPWQLRMLDAIIEHSPDGIWLAAASSGANEPSTRCTACASYPP